MLGFVGFSLVALVVMLYSFSAKNLGTESRTFGLNLYYAAYLILTAALFVFAIGTQVSPENLKYFVVSGDVLVLISTILLARIITPKKYLNLVTALGVIAGALLVYFRAMDVDSVMRDGVLVFYTPRWFGAVLVLVLLVVWLKVNIEFYKKIIVKNSDAEILEPYYFSANLLGYMGMGGFLFARKTLTIVFSFTMLGLSFLLMFLMNTYVPRLSGKGEDNARR